MRLFKLNSYYSNFIAGVLYRPDPWVWCVFRRHVRGSLFLYNWPHNVSARHIDVNTVLSVPFIAISVFSRSGGGSAWRGQLTPVLVAQQSVYRKTGLQASLGQVQESQSDFRLLDMKVSESKMTLCCGLTTAWSVLFVTFDMSCEVS